MALFLGMDAGGSRTRAVLADETRELARVEGESVKVMRLSEAEAGARLGAMLEELAVKAGADLRYVTRTCVGLSGISVEAVREWMRSALMARVGGELELVGDEVIALDAAFPGAAGVLVIAGTGSNIVGRCADGSIHGAGGWGPVLADEGSGYWIGLEAIRAALRAEDRGIVTRLLTDIERQWGLSSLGELVAMANRPGGADFAGLAPVVAACAADGDALATGVLERAGVELAEQVLLVVSKMRAAGCDFESVPVAFTGSVLDRIAPVRKAFEERLEGFRVRAEAVDALDGAVWRARG